LAVGDTQEEIEKATFTRIMLQVTENKKYVYELPQKLLNIC